MIADTAEKRSAGTKNIDALFLELSQFASVKTTRESMLEGLLFHVLKAWKEEVSEGKGIAKKHSSLYDSAMYEIRKLKM